MRSPCLDQNSGQPLGEIDQDEGELALQMGEQILAVLLIEMHDQLAVAMGAEHMTPRLKLRLPLGIVEQLAVADDGDRAVLVENGLVAVRDTDDAKPLLREADPRREQETGIVRTAMGQGRAHARD
jgi:hypothetical protein